MFRVLTNYSHGGKYGHIQANMVLPTKRFYGATFIDGYNYNTVLRIELGNSGRAARHVETSL